LGEGWAPSRRRPCFLEGALRNCEDSRRFSKAPLKLLKREGRLRPRFWPFWSENGNPRPLCREAAAPGFSTPHPKKRTGGHGPSRRPRKNETPPGRTGGVFSTRRAQDWQSRHAHEKDTLFRQSWKGNRTAGRHWRRGRGPSYTPTPKSERATTARPGQAFPRTLVQGIFSLFR
jgi:hypothetical protein